MRVIRYGADYSTKLPVSGGGTDIVAGALMKRGPTAGTNTGFLVVAGGTSAIPDTIGILKEAHTASGYDTNTGGTVFTKRKIELTYPFRVVRVEYDLTAANAILCTEAVSTTDMNVTSLEADIDAAFVYVVDGTGEGQTNFATAAGTNDITLKAAFGTALSTDSYFIKILPRFHKLAALNAAGTKLASQAAAGAIKAMVIDSFIIRDGYEEQLDPTKHAALTGLHNLSSLRFEADICFTDHGAYPVA